MRKLLRRLAGILLFLLAFAPIPLMGGARLLGSVGAGFLLLVPAVPLSLLLSLVPGRIGGKIKEEPVDNTPHKYETESNRRFLAEDAVRRSKPLRGPVTALVMLLFLAAAVLAPIPALSGTRFAYRLLMGAVNAALIPLALALLTDEERLASLCTMIGAILYLIAGVLLVFEPDPALNRALCVLALCFVAMAAVSMNGSALVQGAANKKSGRPSRRILWRNRLLIVGLAAVGAVILYFDRIRQAFSAGAQQVLRWLWAAYIWFSNLLFGDRMPTGEGGGGGGGDMLGGLEGGEPAPFWKFTEKIMLALAAVGAVLVLIWLLRKVYLLLRTLLGRLIAHIRGVAGSLSEEYQDEQEQLDWGDVTRSARESVMRRVRRLTRREKKWSQMDAREKVRFLVRALYRRAGKQDLSSLTIREAAPSLPVNDASPEELSSLYEQARYGREEPDESAAEKLRREVRA